MPLIDLFRLLWAKPLAVLLSIHSTEGDQICGFGAIQPSDVVRLDWARRTISVASAQAGPL